MDLGSNYNKGKLRPHLTYAQPITDRLESSRVQWKVYYRGHLASWHNFLDRATKRIACPTYFSGA